MGRKLNRKQKARAKLAKYDLLEYTKHTFIPEGAYRVNWHHELICSALEKVANFEIRKLIITMPPRSGKSELVSRRFPPWYLSKNPNAQMILATHSKDLMRSMINSQRNTLKEPTHAEVFGEFEFGGKETSGGYTTDAGGTMTGTTVSSAIHGFGADIGIVDDYFKNRSEASSQRERDKIWEWYTDDFTSRLMHPSAQIIMATRFHEDDLIGRILDEEGDDWTVLHLPFIQDDPDPPAYDPRDQGEPLDPERFREGPDEDRSTLVARAKEYFETRKRRNSYGTEALYQGRPTPKEGGLLGRELFSEYWKSPSMVHDKAEDVIVSVDAALKATNRSDKVSCQVIAKYGNNYYLLDEITKKLDFSETVKVIRRLLSKWPKAYPVIEDKANGPAIINRLEEEFPQTDRFNPDKNSKTERIQLAAEHLNQYKFYIPRISENPWVSDWLEDMVGYPSRRYDDRPDAVSQAIMYWRKDETPINQLKRTIGWR